MAAHVRAGAATVVDAPQALYRFFNATGDLLYVGITMNPASRWKSHRDEKPWWLEVTSITVEHHPDRASAEEAERQAIRSERPWYNLVHNPSTKADGERMAGLLLRAPDAQARFTGSCETCSSEALPTRLYPEEAGWFAVYECCSGSWSREVAA